MKYQTGGLRQKLQRVVMCLKPYKPERIILFGSHAWGKPTKDSDIDLFVVKRTKKRPLERIPEARARLYGVRGAFDILVFTPEEVRQRLLMKDFFIEDIMRKGRILYDKSE